MDLVDALTALRSEVASGRAPYSVTTLDIDNLVAHLSLQPMKANDIPTVLARREEVLEQLVLIGQFSPKYAANPQQLASAVEQLNRNFMLAHGIDVRFNRTEIEEKLGGLTEVQRDYVEATLRLSRKLANNAADYFPQQVSETIGKVYAMFNPVPAEQLRSTYGRERYPFGEERHIWTDNRGQKRAAHVNKLSLGDLTLLDQFSVVNREAREVQKLVSGHPKSDGGFFKLLVSEVAPLAIAGWNATRGKDKPREIARYTSQLSDLFDYMRQTVVEHALTGKFDAQCIIARANDTFAKPVPAAIVSGQYQRD